MDTFGHASSFHAVSPSRTKGLSSKLTPLTSPDLKHFHRWVSRQNEAPRGQLGPLYNDSHLCYRLMKHSFVKCSRDQFQSSVQQRFFFFFNVSCSFARIEVEAIFFFRHIRGSFSRNWEKLLAVQ